MPLVQKLERQPSKRESRYVHLFSGEFNGGMSAGEASHFCLYDVVSMLILERYLL